MAAFERAKRKGVALQTAFAAWAPFRSAFCIFWWGSPRQSRVNVLLGRQIVAMPALIVIGLWIALQLFSEVGAIANTNETSDVGGVAYMAHIGGFLAGFLLTFLFRGTIAPQTW